MIQSILLIKLLNYFLQILMFLKANAKIHEESQANDR